MRISDWSSDVCSSDLGGPDLLKAVTTPGTLRDGTPVNYAFGLYTGRTAGRDSIGHSGSISGYRALVTWLPKERFGVVLMANGSPDLGVPTDQIVDLYLVRAPPHPARTRDLPAPISSPPSLPHPPPLLFSSFLS